MEHKTKTQSIVSTRVIRPFVGVNWWIPIYNDIIDTVLTQLSGGALKVLLFIAGQPWPPQPGVAPYLQRHLWQRATCSGAR